MKKQKVSEQIKEKLLGKAIDNIEAVLKGEGKTISDKERLSFRVLNEYGNILSSETKAETLTLLREKHEYEKRLKMIEA